MTEQELQEALREPFPEKDIQWMPQQLGSNGKDADMKPWVMVLAYVDARALQERLDEVFGVLGWQDSYIATANGIICTLSVKTEVWKVVSQKMMSEIPEGAEYINEEGCIKTTAWISKSNGAPETDIEAFKGGISSAFKRVCASGLGVGRYLYDLETSFATCQYPKPSGKRSELKARGWNKAKDKETKKDVWWQKPVMPAWALPEPKEKGEK